MNKRVGFYKEIMMHCVDGVVELKLFVLSLW